MKKTLSFLALLLAILMLFTACDSTNDPSSEASGGPLSDVSTSEEQDPDEDPSDVTTDGESDPNEHSSDVTTSEETDPEDNPSDVTSGEETDPAVDPSDVTTREENDPEDNPSDVTTREENDSAVDPSDVTTREEQQPEVDPPSQDPPATSTSQPRKILAIGNSFSVDAMQHLAEILVAEGYSDFILGNLYKSSCTLDIHKECIENGANAYEFRVNTGSGWTKSDRSIQYGLSYTDWDVVTIQQASKQSGLPDTYGNMQYIIDYVKEKVSPTVKIVWHMTWAYQASCDSDNFKNYGNNQMTMYNAIVDTVKANVLTNADIQGIIPSGTAIQNLRTSYLGDTLNRDGIHLTKDIGRYTAALTWYKALTGADISDLTVVPKEYPSVAQHLDAIKEAVTNAIANPFVITPSTFTKSDLPLNEMTDADRRYLESLGLNPNDYEVLDLGIIVCGYYNSTKSSSVNTTSSSLSPKFIATKIFSVEELPVGSVVNVLSGYQYRLEGWQDLNAKNSLARRDESTRCITITADLYEDYNYIAFNISKTDDSKVALDDCMGFRIYVLKTN